MVARAPLLFWRALFTILTVGCACARRSADPTNIAENLFISFSNACRTLMKSYDADPQLESETKRLEVVWYDRTGGKHTFPIDSAVRAARQSQLFDGRSDTVITIHGFNDHAESAIPSAIARAYVNKENHNVMLLDCSAITSVHYVRAAYMSKLIGARLAEFLKELVTTFDIAPESIHLIGISLGAQSAGWAGRTFQKISDRKLKRITGLDPAGPCFTYADDSESLNANDALYVDVIHVNRGIQGILEYVGHADYFVNGGGPNQPGCKGPNCSHHRAGLLYIESLNEDIPFMARECASWSDFNNYRCLNNEISEMGCNSSMKTRGKFYMRTRSIEPFSLGDAGSNPRPRGFFANLLNFGY